MLVDVVGADTPCGDVGCYQLCGAGNVPASGITQRKVEHQPVAVGSVVEALLQTAAWILRHAVEIAYHAQAHIVFYQVRGLALYGYADEVHQCVDLGLRAVPVLC